MLGVYDGLVVIVAGGHGSCSTLQFMDPIKIVMVVLNVARCCAC